VREGKNKQHGRLGHRADNRIRGDVNGYIALRAGCQIDIVVADTAPSNGGETAGGRERGGRDAGFEGNQDVQVLELTGSVFGQVLLKEPMLQAGLAVECVQAEIGKYRLAGFA
jgi:hypothetical protein